MRLLPVVLLILVTSCSTFGQTYTINTVAGSGPQVDGGFGGDNGPATSARLYSPNGVAVDPAGNLYIADTDNSRIRKVSGGVITTFAGNGAAGFSGDNGPATNARLFFPTGVAVDSAGSLYIADINDNCIRKVSNGVITTVAGTGTAGFNGDYGPATSAQLYDPRGIAVDSTGNLYIADMGNNRVRRVSNGVITTIAGNGTQGFSGDNGPAISAGLYNPTSVAVDSAGDLYIADDANYRIRKVSNGVITTVAGNGTRGFSGDSGPATSAGFDNPIGVAVDPAGNLYIADYNRIRKVLGGAITTIAGNGTQGFSGDSGPATSAQLYYAHGITTGPGGTLYVADSASNRIRILTPVGPSCAYSVAPTSLQAPATGGNLTVSIQTGASCSWAVSGLPGWITTAGASSGAGPATVTLVVSPNNAGAPLSTTVLIAGLSVTVTQPAPATTCSYSLSSSSDSLAAGGGSGSFNVTAGSGCTWTATIDVSWITTTSSGSGNGTVNYTVPANSGPQRTGHITVGGQVFTVTQAAASVTCSYSLSSTSASVAATGGSGSFNVTAGSGCAWTVVSGASWITITSPTSGTGNGTVTYSVVANTGAARSATILVAGASVTITQAAAGSALGQTYTISTVAGNGTGTQGFSGDSGPATSAQLAYPMSIAADSGGDLYIADTGNNRIRKVSNGVITTVAGNGTGGFSGDNGSATGAWLNQPYGVAADSAGNLYIADFDNNLVRKVSNGVISTVAGNGRCCFSGDNGQATSAGLYGPAGVAVDSAGNLYIADSYNSRIRKVTNGVITTVAGNGTQGFSGDNGAATSAQLTLPSGVAVDSAGNLYIADAANQRIRKVSNGVITTVAGNGGAGFSGDNGPATSAALSGPTGVAVDSASNLYIAEGYRIRKVSNGVITTVAGGGSFLGDTGPATSAELTGPRGVAVDSAGNLYIAEYGYSRIRMLTPCAYSVGPISLQASGSGGTLTVGIQTTTSCSWAVSGLPGWITVSGASSGTGPGSVTLVVAPNSGTAVSATISIAGVSVTVSQPTAPLPTIKSLVNAASYATGAVSPGELVTIFGTDIGPTAAASATTDPATGKLATTIGGVQVLFNGTAAPMIYASSTQVSAVVPYEMAPVVSPSVWIKYLGQTSNVLQLTSATTAPGLFTQNSSGSGPGAILNQDNSVNGPGNGAAKGSIVQVYMTGEGQTRPLGVTGAITTPNLPPPQVTPAPVLAVGVTINGQPALYVYAGEAPGLVAGMMQLNVQIPASGASGELPILVSVGGNTSQKGVTVSVQ